MGREGRRAVAPARMPRAPRLRHAAAAEPIPSGVMLPLPARS